MKRRRPPNQNALPVSAEFPEHTEQDDTLTLFFMCCHPVPDSVVRNCTHVAGGGRADHGRNCQCLPRSRRRPWPSESAAPSTASRLRAFPFQLPSSDERGQTASRCAARAVSHLQRGLHHQRRTELAAARTFEEAIRLTRSVFASLPQDPEVAGLLALMLLTDARRHARTGPDGDLIPLIEAGQNALGSRRRFRRASQLLRRLFPKVRSAVISCRLPSRPFMTKRNAPEDTDWPQILALYELLKRIIGQPDGGAQSRYCRGDGAWGNERIGTPRWARF